MKSIWRRGEMIYAREAPLVSVVIGTYDRWALLREAIASALRQSYKILEVIVSDDAGPKEIAEVVQSFNDLRIRYFRNETNLGIGGNYAKAFLQVRGKYVTILNDDDLWEVQFVERLLTPLENNSELAAAFCDHYVIDEKNEIDFQQTARISKQYGRDRLAPGIHKPFARLALIDGAVPDAMGTLFRTDSIDWKLFQRESGSFYSLYLSYLACRTGEGAFYCPERLTRYRYHSQMETRAAGIRMSSAGVFCYQRFLEDPKLKYLGDMLELKMAGYMEDYGAKLFWSGEVSAAQKRLWQVVRYHLTLRAILLLTSAIILAVFPQSARMFFVRLVAACKAHYKAAFDTNKSTLGVRWRRLLATAFRILPHFRGKGPLGVAVGRFLANPNAGSDALETFRMCDGSTMKLDLRSRTERWAFWTGQYEPDLVSAFSKILEPETVVLDIGANIGFYSIALGRKLKRLGGKVYAFEPVPANFARLQEVIRLNDLSETVLSFCVALGSIDSEVNFCLEDTDGASTGNAVFLPTAPAKSVTRLSTETRLDQMMSNGFGNAKARMTTLDRFMNIHNVKRCDFVKVDIEGAEWEFFQGAGGFLQKHRPIVFAECNAHWMRRFGHSVCDILRMGAALDYKCYRYIRRKGFVIVGRAEDGIQDILLLSEEALAKFAGTLGIK